MRHYILTFLFTFSLFNLVEAQTVQNVQARPQENVVIISYELIGTAEGQTFNVELKSSHNNFGAPLKEVVGDVGEGQLAGPVKTITWNAMNEIGVFSGDISFEIVATVTFTPLQFTAPAAGAGLKIGKAANVRWQGDTPSALQMSLMKSNQQLLDLGNVGNSGNYTWNVPKTLEKGGGYSLKLLDPTKPNQSVMSAEFLLKKTSILVYIIPAVVVVGVGVALLISGGDGGCDDVCNPACENYNMNAPQCVTTLPTPPDPGG